MDKENTKMTLGYLYLKHKRNIEGSPRENEHMRKKSNTHDFAQKHRNIEPTIFYYCFGIQHFWARPEKP